MEGDGRKAETMRSIVEGRKLERAPWRRREPTSSSSKRPTRLMVFGEEEEEAASRASMAA